MARCNSCGAKIIWAVTPKGARIPVDAIPTEDGNLVLEEHRGQLVACVVGQEPGLFASPRHKSHFATCPHASQHRRPR